MTLHRSYSGQHISERWGRHVIIKCVNESKGTDSMYCHAGEAGRPLPARTGHSCTVLPEGRLLIFGGMDDAGKFKNDMFVIDVKRLVWFAMKAKGAPPKGRAYHS